MNFTPVRSSNVKAIGYDPDAKVMGVQFQDGSEYHYEGVPYEVYFYVQHAPSVGRTFAQVVKNNYSATRIR